MSLATRLVLVALGSVLALAAPPRALAQVGGNGGNQGGGGSGLPAPDGAVIDACLGLNADDDSCEDLIEAVRCSGGTLSVRQIEAILRCSGCDAACLAAEDQKPEVTCGPAVDSCTGLPLDSCGLLKKSLQDALVCFIAKKLQEGDGPIPDHEIDRALGLAACAFLTECATESPTGGSTPPMTCRQLVACLSMSPAFRDRLTGDFFCGLFSGGCTACQQELCSLNGTGSPEDCDLTGDGAVDCDDLKLLIEIKKGCACASSGQGGAAGGGPVPALSDADLIALACKFFGAGGCAQTSNPELLDCKDIAKCLQSIDGFPADALCSILNGSCDGSTPPAGPPPFANCSTNICDALDDPSLICTPGGWSLPANPTAADVAAVLAVMRCCPNAPATDEEWRKIICALMRCIDGNSACEVVLEAMLKVWGDVRAGEILLAGAGENGACVIACELADELRKLAERKANGCNVQSSAPVHLATGEKVESSTDLVVRLPGGDFSITRSYSSRITGASDRSKSIVGAGWSLSTIQFVHTLPVGESGLGAVTSVQIHAESANTYREFTKDAVDGTFKADRADLSVVRRVVGDVPISATANARAWLWQLETPGEGTRHFVAGIASDADDPSGPGTAQQYASTVTRLRGLLVRETTVHGRRSEYLYANYGSPALRPNSIYLAMIGSETRADARARVVYGWHHTAGAEKGRLRRIAVYRGPSTAPELTDSVDYLYKSVDTDPEGEISNDLGTAGDLVQVVARQRTDSVGGDGKPLYYSRVTQYRYHRSGAQPDGANSSVSTVVGDDHQLTMVIKPEQIEYFAERALADTPFCGTVDTTVLAAGLLLRLDDDEDAFTDTGGVRKLTDLAAKVVGYGAPDTSAQQQRRVAVQFLQASCGCAGSAQGVKLELEYIAASPTATRRSAVVRECMQSQSGGYETDPFRVTRHDLAMINEVPYLVSRAISATVNPTARDGATWWVWGYKLDSGGRRTHAFMPSSIASYAPAAGAAPSSFSVKTGGQGLVERYVYAGDTRDGRVLERRVGSGDSDSVASYALVERTAYLSGPMRSYLPTIVERFRWSGLSAADDVETTTYSYGFRGGDTSADLAWVSTMTEMEVTAENGVGGNATSFQLIDPRGQTIATRSAVGVVSQWTYDSTTGAVNSHTANAGTLGLNGADYPGLTGWNWSAQSTIPGGAIRTGYENDALGRVTATRRADYLSDEIDPNDPTPVTTRTRRELRASPERPGVLYYAEVSLPHKLVDGTVSGPASVTLMNAGGGVIRSSDWTVALDGANYTLVTEVARSVVDHAVTGVVTETRRWSSVADNRFDTTPVRYDAIGRLKEKVSPNGSIERYTYDLLDRVIAIDAGVDNGPQPVRVAEFYYDSGTAAVQGIGDGNLTLVRQFHGEGSGYRDSVRVYDQRNRLVQAWGPTAGTLAQAVGPHEVRAYDNLDRLVERGLFSQLSNPTQGGNQDALIATNGTNRLLYSRISSSQRGLPVRGVNYCAAEGPLLLQETTGLSLALLVLPKPHRAPL